MRMVVIGLAMAGIALAPAGAQARSVLGSLLVGDGPGGRVKDTKDGRMKVTTTAKRDEGGELAAMRALQALATHAQAKGAPRFVVIKESCGAWKMRNVTVSYQCKVTARTLTADEAAPQAETGPASVFNTAEVLTMASFSRP